MGANPTLDELLGANSTVILLLSPCCIQQLEILLLVYMLLILVNINYSGIATND